MFSRLGSGRAVPLLRTVLQHTARRQIHEHFQYSRAIVGSLNDRFADFSVKFEEPDVPISLQNAKQQHTNYVQQLRRLLPGKIIQIPPNNAFPDQVFVEDPGVVYDGIALLTKMKEATRAGEKEMMTNALEQLGLPIYEMKNPNAILDGGDVLFTGREFFVGISSRTNAVRIAH